MMMPLLKPTIKTEKKQIRIAMNEDLLNDIMAYCEWSGRKDETEFFVQAAHFVLSKDKDWHKAQTKA